MTNTPRVMDPSPQCSLCISIEAGKVLEVRKQIHLDRDQCECEKKYPVYRMIKLYQRVLRQARTDSMPKGAVWKSPEVHKSNMRSLILQTIAQLLAGGAVVSYTTGVETPLMAALSTCDEDLLWTLLDFKADVNLSDGLEDMNALGLAILLNEAPLVEMLLKHGGKVNAPCCGNLMPIQLALNKKPGVSSVLIQYGADPHLLHTIPVTAEEQLFTGQSPLLVAVLRRNLHLCRLLLEHGEDVNQTFPDSLESPIHTAVRNLDTDMIELLVSFGADLNKPNFERHTPLGLALLMAEDEHPQATEVAKRLVLRGASPNRPTRISFFQRTYSPLHIACFKGNFEFVRFLVEDVCGRMEPLVDSQVAESSHVSLKDRDSTAQRNAAAAATDCDTASSQGRFFKLLPRTDRRWGSSSSQPAGLGQGASRSFPTADASRPGSDSGFSAAEDSESHAGSNNGMLGSDTGSSASTSSVSGAAVSRPATDGVSCPSAAPTNAAVGSLSGNSASTSSGPGAACTGFSFGSSLGSSNSGSTLRMSDPNGAGQIDTRSGHEDGREVQTNVWASLMDIGVSHWPQDQAGDAGDQYRVRSEVASATTTQPAMLSIGPPCDGIENSISTCLPREEETASSADHEAAPLALPSASAVLDFLGTHSDLEAQTSEDEGMPAATPAGEGDGAVLQGDTFIPGEGETASSANHEAELPSLPCASAVLDFRSSNSDLEPQTSEDGDTPLATAATEGDTSVLQGNTFVEHPGHHKRLDHGAPPSRFEKVRSRPSMARVHEGTDMFNAREADAMRLRRQPAYISMHRETFRTAASVNARGQRQLGEQGLSAGPSDLPQPVEHLPHPDPPLYSSVAEMCLRIMNPPTTAWAPAVSIDTASPSQSLAPSSSPSASGGDTHTMAIETGAIVQSPADVGGAVDPASLDTGSGVRVHNSSTKRALTAEEEWVQFQVEFGSPGYDYDAISGSKQQDSTQKEEAEPNPAEGEEGKQGEVANEEEAPSKSVVHFLNKAGGDGCTALFMAVYDGNERLVDFLLDHGARPDFTSHHGNFFHAAVLSQSFPLIRRALELGCDINEHNVFGNSPLTLVSRLDLPEACELLVTHGANMNSRDRYGETPLLASVYFGCERNAQILIQHGATMDLVDDNHTSAIYWAIFNNRQHTLKLLLMAGAHFTPFTLNQYPRNIRVMHNRPLMAFIHDYISQPRSLQDLATVRVRKHLTEVWDGANILPHVAELPIPSRLKDMLRLLHFVAIIDNDTDTSPASFSST